jgi:hypothetical protein
MLKRGNIPDRERPRLAILYAIAPLQGYGVIREVLILDLDLRAFPEPQSAFSLEGNGMCQCLVSYISCFGKPISEFTQYSLVYFV